MHQSLKFPIHLYQVYSSSAGIILIYFDFTASIIGFDT